MEITEQQKEAIKNWAAEGCKLSEIQKRLKDEFGVALTFMDLRFLVLDMDVKLKDKEQPREKTLEPDLVESPADPASAAGDEFGGAGGSVSVTIDRVKKPGALSSGTVTFSDGTHASWTLDQLGRLALNADKPDYTPSESDIQEFQMELQAQIQRRGL